MGLAPTFSYCSLFRQTHQISETHFSLKTFQQVILLQRCFALADPEGVPVACTPLRPIFGLGVVQSHYSVLRVHKIRCKKHVHVHVLWPTHGTGTAQLYCTALSSQGTARGKPSAAMSPQKMAAWKCTRRGWSSSSTRIVWWHTCARFSTQSCQAVCGLCLLPATLSQCSDKRTDDIIQCYGPDMPGSASAKQEIRIWERFWADSPKPELLATLSSTLEKINSGKFPCILAVLDVPLLLPVTSAEVQRAHSAFKLIKTKLRSTMAESCLNALILL